MEKEPQALRKETLDQDWVKGALIWTTDIRKINLGPTIFLGR